MRNGFFLFAALFFASFPAQAQPHRLVGDVSIAAIGSGGQNIPSVRVGYARSLSTVFDVNVDTRFSHRQMFGNEDVGQRGNFTYLNGSAGLTLSPLNSDRHRFSLGVHGAIRHRWETQVVQSRSIIGGPVLDVDYKRETSVDTGFLLRTGYSYRLTKAFRVGGHLHGYTYQEGTSVVVFGMLVEYAL